MESVLAQTHPDVELIVVDAGSTDRSPAVAQAVIDAHPDARIELVNQPASEHPAHARNRGVQVARGEYLLCLDPHDGLPPDFIERCAAASTPIRVPGSRTPITRTSRPRATTPSPTTTSTHSTEPQLPGRRRALSPQRVGGGRRLRRAHALRRLGLLDRMRGRRPPRREGRGYGVAQPHEDERPLSRRRSARGQAHARDARAQAPAPVQPRPACLGGDRARSRARATTSRCGPS